MSVPNEASREKILRALTRESKVADDVDYEVLARRTPGFVGADLEDLVLPASEAAMERCLSVLEADAAADLIPTAARQPRRPPRAVTRPCPQREVLRRNAGDIPSLSATRFLLGDEWFW